MIRLNTPAPSSKATTMPEMTDPAQLFGLGSYAELRLWTRRKPADTDALDRPRDIPCGAVMHEQDIDHAFLHWDNFTPDQKRGFRQLMRLGDEWRFSSYPWRQRECAE